MKISVSLLSSYLFCSRKLFLEQVLKMKSFPKEATVKGTIKHNVLDLINKQEKGIINSINDQTNVQEKYLNLYSKNLINSIRVRTEILVQHKIQPMQIYNEMWPFFQEDAKLRSNYVSEYISKYNIYGNELWESLTPKIITEIYIESDLLELKGKIDRIEKYKDRYIPVEIKTGRAPQEGVWEGHLIQIGAYMLLMEEKYGIKVDTGKVHYLGTGEREVKMNPFLKEEILKIKDEVKNILSSKDLPDFVKNKKKCETCPLREDCYGM
jgi:CRISPR-associated protein Cas4